MTGQAKRILAHLLENPDKEIPAVTLNRIGSGKENGWCASFTRRISDIRKLGYNVVKCYDFMVDGQRHTGYKIRRVSILTNN